MCLCLDCLGDCFPCLLCCVFVFICRCIHLLAVLTMYLVLLISAFISASMDGKCIVDMTIFIASAKEVMFLPEFVCLSVC